MNGVFPQDSANFVVKTPPKLTRAAGFGAFAIRGVGGETLDDFERALHCFDRFEKRYLVERFDDGVTAARAAKRTDDAGVAQRENQATDVFFRNLLRFCGLVEGVRPLGAPLNRVKYVNRNDLSWKFSLFYRLFLID